MKIDKDFDKVLESHYGDKPYWNDFCDSYKKWHERIFNKNKQRKSEFAFIICENNDQYFDECVYYINRLNVPEGYDIDVISIKEADSMCSAYNAAMNSSNARYKIYLHQDVFIRNQNFLYDILAVFQSDPQIGIIGMVGGKNMSILTDWHFGLLDVREPGISFYLVHRESNKKNVEVDAVDGLLIATQYDIPWREDLFTHFDMYDISQSFEMRRAGYKVVVPAQKEPWVIHNSGYAKYKYYAAEREKCINEYPEFFASDKGWFEKYDEEQNNLNNILHDQAKLSFTLRQWDKVRDIIRSC
ncbi:MAG: hypothetical protein FRC54_07420 [bacterium LCO1.1]|uniref:Streptomycin biosynthesis protein StrF domain-containing protein n=1 Tax=Candidatus Weimeria bifida TaxID=2599074 RepID=A0A6N7J0Y4_9FIRM|nr:hypothetical protein [Candidatus Weimeria bifida]